MIYFQQLIQTLVLINISYRIHNRQKTTEKSKKLQNRYVNIQNLNEFRNSIDDLRKRIIVLKNPPPNEKELDIKTVKSEQEYQEDRPLFRINQAFKNFYLNQQANQNNLMEWTLPSTWWPMSTLELSKLDNVQQIMIKYLFNQKSPWVVTSGQMSQIPFLRPIKNNKFLNKLVAPPGWFYLSSQFAMDKSNAQAHNYIVIHQILHQMSFCHTNDVVDNKGAIQQWIYLLKSDNVIFNMQVVESIDNFNEQLIEIQEQINSKENFKFQEILNQALFKFFQCFQVLDDRIINKTDFNHLSKLTHNLSNRTFVIKYIIHQIINQDWTNSIIISELPQEYDVIEKKVKIKWKSIIRNGIVEIFKSLDFQDHQEFSSWSDLYLNLIKIWYLNREYDIHIQFRDLVSTFIQIHTYQNQFVNLFMPGMTMLSSNKQASLINFRQFQQRKSNNLQDDDYTEVREKIPDLMILSRYFHLFQSLYHQYNFWKCQEIDLGQESKFIAWSNTTSHWLSYSFILNNGYLQSEDWQFYPKMVDLSNYQLSNWKNFQTTTQKTQFHQFLCRLELNNSQRTSQNNYYVKEQFRHVIQGLAEKQENKRSEITPLVYQNIQIQQFTQNQFNFLAIFGKLQLFEYNISQSIYQKAKTSVEFLEKYQNLPQDKRDYDIRPLFICLQNIVKQNVKNQTQSMSQIQKMMQRNYLKTQYKERMYQPDTLYQFRKPEDLTHEDKALDWFGIKYVNFIISTFENLCECKISKDHFLYSLRTRYYNLIMELIFKKQTMVISVLILYKNVDEIKKNHQKFQEQFSDFANKDMNNFNLYTIKLLKKQNFDIMKFIFELANMNQDQNDLSLELQIEKKDVKSGALISSSIILSICQKYFLNVLEKYQVDLDALPIEKATEMLEKLQEKELIDSSYQAFEQLLKSDIISINDQTEFDNLQIWNNRFMYELIKSVESDEFIKENK